MTTSNIEIINLTTKKGFPFVGMNSNFYGEKIPLYNNWQETISNLFGQGWNPADLALLLKAAKNPAGESFEQEYKFEDLMSSHLFIIDWEDDNFQSVEFPVTIRIFTTVNNLRWVKQFNAPAAVMRDTNGNNFNNIKINFDIDL